MASIILGFIRVSPNPNVHLLARGHKKSLFDDELGLNAFKLFNSSKMAIFFIFACFLGGRCNLPTLTAIHSFTTLPMPQYAT